MLDSINVNKLQEEMLSKYKLQNVMHNLIPFIDNFLMARGNVYVCIYFINTKLEYNTTHGNGKHQLVEKLALVRKVNRSRKEHTGSLSESFISNL